MGCFDFSHKTLDCRGWGSLVNLHEVHFTRTKLPKIQKSCPQFVPCPIQRVSPLSTLRFQTSTLRTGALRPRITLCLHEALPHEDTRVHDAAFEALGRRLAAGVRRSDVAAQFLNHRQQLRVLGRLRVAHGVTGD